jgi:sugar phosphate isomerase/epimerase
LPEPQLSISAVSTLTASFADDLDAYVAAGADGIGLWELKLPAGEDERSLELVRESGLEVTNCVPLVPSILPLPLIDGPIDPRERIEAICASIRRLAAFEPRSIVCLTGPALERTDVDARRIVVDGLRRIGREAKANGLRVGLEPFQRLGHEEWALATSIGEAVELLGEADEPALGITFDVWHLWNCETLHDDIHDHAPLFTAVHVSDWREPTRGWADRVLPGDGVAGVPAILTSLDAAGWTGPYDLEVFSDNGAFGNAYDDSLWDVPAAELARRGREAFHECWRASRTVDLPSPGGVRL